MRDMSLRKVLTLPVTKPADELVPGSFLYMQKTASKKLNIACFDESGERPGKAIRDHRITGPSTLYQSAPGVNVLGIFKIANFDSFTVYDVSVSSGSVTIEGDTITVTPPTEPGKVYLNVNGEHSLIVIKPPAVLPPHITYPQTGMSFIDAVEVQLSAFATSGPADTADITKWQVSKDPLFETGVSETITDGDDLTQLLSLPESGTTYYIRGMRSGTTLGDSEWSDIVSVSTRLKSSLISEIGIITPSAPVVDGFFASMLAVSNDGKQMIVSAKKGFGTNGLVGGFYQYSLDENDLWVLSSSIAVSGVVEGDAVGGSGSISEDGSVFATGIPVCSQYPTGAVAVFRKNADVWENNVFVLPSLTANIAQFGFSVSLSKGGTHLAVGAPNAYSNNGRVFIFEYIDDAWVEQQVLSPDSGVANEYYGYSLHLNASASMLVIGSINHAPITPANKTGCAYLYSREGALWTLERKLYTADANNGAMYGFSVAVNDSGTEAYVAGTGRVVNGVASGSVKVYSKYSSVPWSEVAELIPEEGQANQTFGCALSINAGGSRLVIGSCHKDNHGAFYLYDRTEESWQFTCMRKATIPRLNAYFGNKIEINKTGSEVYVGSRGDSEVQTNGGKAYHFK